MASRRNSRWAPLIMVAVLGLLVFAVRNCKQSSNPANDVQVNDVTKEVRGLNRNPSHLIYSKHAQCRMDCRKIDSSEVQEILRSGKINYRKSEIGDRPDCKRKYAVEGVTRDKQKVRIIFAPCKSDVTVVTVIDIGREWPCDCK